ncbi:DNA methyltransferase [candidate division KSB1 bacterium]
MESLFQDKTELGSLVSPQSNQHEPIYSWFSFKHGFSKDLVEKIIQEFDLKTGDWVLDPFCGSGTTLLTCKNHRIRAMGFDILPFSVYLTNIKSQNYDEISLVEQLRKFKKIAQNKINTPALPDIPLIAKAFNPAIWRELLLLKSQIDSIEDTKIRNFFNLGFLSILEPVSDTTKAGGFLRITKKEISKKDIRNLFLKKIVSMISDVILINNNGKIENISCSAKIGDARKISTNRSFNAIITSPPYPNRHDYTRIYSLEMIFDFVKSNDELKNIRYDTLRSHVEAKKRFNVKNYSKPEILNDLLKKIERNGTNNPQVVEMLEGYFEDMAMAISEMKNHLKNNGKIALVVSNVRFAGINIPVDEILGEIGKNYGLKIKSIWILRYRGNSSQQMKKYKRSPSRESIVIWEK